MTEKDRAKRRAACRAWYARNKERERIRSKEKYLRYRSTEAGREHIRALEKLRYRKNPLKAALQRDAWRDKYPEKARATGRRYGRQWRLANPEKARQIDRAWRLKHPERHAAKQARRRATKRNAQPQWANTFFVSEIYHLARLRSHYLGSKFEVDHIVPLKSSIVCGLHVENNLQIIPKIANVSKGNRSWPDMP